MINYSTRSKRLKMFMAILGLLPFISHRVTSLLIVSVFVLAWFAAPYLSRLPKLWLPLWFRYVGVGLLCSALTEYFVFKEHFEVFNPNVSVDIFLSLGIYGSLMIIWYFLLKRYQFSLKEMFVAAGIWGVVFEQNFRVLLSFNLLGYLVVFLVYGSLMSIPFLFFGQEFEAFARPTQGKKFLKVFLWQCLGYVGGFLWIAIFRTVLHIK